MARRWSRIGAAALALSVLVGGDSLSLNAWDFARGHLGARSAIMEARAPAAEPVARGVALFTYGDFGGLDTDAMETVAVPWKLTTAALVLAQSPDDISEASLKRILARYGFLDPEILANWPSAAGPQSERTTPLGVTVGTGRRSVPALELEIGNTGCAACHAGPTYDRQGRPSTREAWLGAPNPSVNFEAYTRDTYAALVAGMATPERLLEAVRTLHPTMSDREARTLERFVLPRARARLRALEAAGTGAGPLPFSNGLPGLTNGVAALKLQHGSLVGDSQARPRERGFTSIPHLSDRIWRSALLWDGAYAPPGQARFRPMLAGDLTQGHRDSLAAITAYFTVPSMGVSGDRARRSIPDVELVWRFLESVRPQPFPGPIDPARAAAGRDLFQHACASCHGTYAETPAGPRLVSFPNWAGDVGTDKTRAAVMTPELAARVRASPLRRRIDAASTGVYAAPPLTGLWQSAPYLHNGAVPSLAALLGLEPRPARFLVGGHALDFGSIGVWYPEGYTPYSDPAWLDTREPGLGAQGHEAPFTGLSLEDRRNLLEYLKRL